MIRSRRGGRRRNADTADLNITAFMNLMVILVPFLLMTAVFSRLAILELNLPGSSSETTDPGELSLQLEITVRGNRIEIGDRNGGALGVYPNTDEGYDFAALGEKLVEIKRRFPEKTDAAILLEADIPYDTLVKVMDRVRVELRREADSVTRAELFPDISIGDAPSASGGA